MSRARMAFLAGLVIAAAAAATGGSLAAFSKTTDNTASSFATASSFFTCPGTAMPDYMTGFEMGRRAAQGQTNFVLFSPANVDATAASVRTGAYSAKFAPTSGAAQYGQWTNNANVSATTMVVRVALRLSALPGANVNQLLSLNATTGMQLRYVAATQKLAVALRPNSSTAYTVVPASSTIQAGQWYVLDIRTRVAAPTHIVDWRIDGTPQSSASVAAAASTTPTLTLGSEATTTDSYTAHFDDLMISDTSTDYPFGDGRIHAIWPTGVGTHNNPGSVIKDNTNTAIGATSWNLLDEVPMVAMTDFVQQTAVNTSAYAEFTFGQTTETCIRAARSYYVTHSAAFNANKTNHVKILVRDGTQETILLDGSSLANNTNPRDYSMTLTPQTTWTQSAINGLKLRFGFSSDISNEVPKLDSAMIEYEVPQ